MSEIYRMFSEDLPNMDFSEEAALEYFDFEATGKGDFKFGLFGSKSKQNGFAVGKHWMDVTVGMWKQDIKDKVLFRFELEGVYPDWWLDRVLPRNATYGYRRHD